MSATSIAPKSHFATRTPPQWSPSGSKLLIRDGLKTLVLDEELNTESQIGPEDKWVAYGEWTPDGDRVTYSYFDLHEKQHTEKHWGVFSSKPDGSDEKMLSATGWRAEPSPDGKKVGFHLAKKEVPTRLAVMDSNGVEERVLVGGGGLGEVNWTPDSKEIIFSKRQAGGHGLQAVNVETGKERELVKRTGPNSDTDPELSPDGKTLIFERVNRFRGDTKLFKLDMESGEVSQFAAPNRRQWDVAWSPDGSQVLFSSEVVSGDSDLYLANADGTGLQKITDLPGHEHGPSWSPDGKSIAFYRYDWRAPVEQQRLVHTMSLEDGALKQRIIE